jgi:hypothetical protein
MTRFAIIVLFVMGGCGQVPEPPDAMVDVPMPACAADSMYCGSPEAVYQCNTEGTGGTKVQDCEHGCADGACRACAPGTTFCNGDDLSMCDATGNIAGSTSCMAHGCQMDHCNACTPGEHYCANGAAVTCNDDGTPGESMACGASGCTDGVCNACTPGATTCEGDTLVVCDGDGRVASATTCALGCSIDGGPRCRSLVPSYGVGVPTGVDDSDLDIDSSATIDTSSCTSVPNTVALTIGSTTTSLVGAPHVAVVAQSGAPPICVLKYHNVAIAAGRVLTIKNSAAVGEALALEASSAINILGTIAFRNSAIGSAGGTSTTAAAIKGDHHAPGAGGGGNGRTGGSGGTCPAPGCSRIDVAGGSGGEGLSIARLFSGSKGGDVVLAGTTTALASGGLGGGALHLIALQSITIGTTGRVDVTGRGGTGATDLPAGGGGAGGTVVIETPSLAISQGAIIAANGGGGAGGCYSCIVIAGLRRCSHANGQQGQLSTTRATGGACTNGGNGGFQANGVLNPPPNGQSAAPGTGGGGGGGGDGVIVLRARDAARRVIASTSVLSPPPVLGNVGAN